MSGHPLGAAHPGTLPKLNVYVDETGDRGISRQSSPFFAMTALMVPAGMPSARVVHVIVPKEAARTAPGMANRDRFYNYTTRLLLERVAYTAQQWEGGPRLAIVRLGHVSGMHHADTAGYLDFVRQRQIETWGVPWQHIKWPPVWMGTDWDGIQLADLHAGLLNCALSGDPDDEACAANLLLCKHQLYRSRNGRLLGYGVKVLGNTSFVTGRSWWEKWSVA
ncbi:DUF3800 domain-containing protein [Streptomyces sp. NPDC059569]|uniref:DUF3800 domain-containing protein n=1 Tax=Streptomyces sp. NPDC059569 TaxID=3346869 RepID=UPI0036AE1803